MKSICEICNKKNLPTALYLGKHPLCDERIKIGSSKKNQTNKVSQRSSIHPKDITPISDYYNIIAVHSICIESIKTEFIHSRRYSHTINQIN